MSSQRGPALTRTTNISDGSDLRSTSLLLPRLVVLLLSHGRPDQLIVRGAFRVRSPTLAFASGAQPWVKAAQSRPSTHVRLYGLFPVGSVYPLSIVKLDKVLYPMGGTSDQRL